tara:strand:+ start:337 stop:528 length:192 start_codon:yes stop_codon:yes gene_type:complete
MSLKLEIGDGIFYSAISLIITVLLWLRYLEKFLSLWWAVLIWSLIFVVIIYAIKNNYKKKSNE